MEDKLEKDLQETQQSLMSEMREHGLLFPSGSLNEKKLGALMKPI